MRIAFIFLLIASSLMAATNKDTFIAKVLKYEKIFDNKKLPKLTDAILGDIAKGLTMEQVADNVMGTVIGIMAADPFGALSLLSLKGNMDTCLKPYGSETMGTLTTMMPGMSLALTKTYKLMKKKMLLMKANSKTSAQIVDQLYYLGSAVCTPDLVQHIIWFAQKNISAGQWTCCVKYMPQILNLDPFDKTFRPNKWMYPYKK